MAIVESAKLSKWYGQVIGLNDVTVTLPAGITGLLGPNGAGKSTFMKLMTGQLKPSKGSIKVLGEPIWGNPSLYFRIGFCPDQDAFYDRMTGLEWVAALVRLNGYSEAAVDRRGAPGARHGGPARRGRPQDWQLQQGHAPARQARPGDRARPRAADSRRAAVGHGPARPPQDDSAGQGLGARRQDDHRLEPHPARDRVDDVEHPADQQRPDPGRGQRPPDPRPDRHAPAHGPHPRGRHRAASRGGSWRTTM